MKTSRLRISLHKVEPAVLRVIDVPGAITLAELHPVLQAALGWTDTHLHEFTAGEMTYGVPGPDAPAGLVDESETPLSTLPTRFGYLYDFGDGWSHEIVVLGPGGDRTGCVYGEGDCPPEDCGGPSGYTELCRVLADPGHAEHDRMREWMGVRAEFDQDRADERVRWAVGEVPASVRLLLDLLAGGVRLTPGGRLPRVLVRQVQQRFPHWCALDRPANLEEDLPALTALHDLLRRVGLLRLRTGVLTPTRAAGDDLAVVRRVRSWFDPGGFSASLTGLAVAVLVTAGPHSPEQLAAAVHPMLDARWAHVDGRPVTERDVRMSLYRLAPVLAGLDQIEVDWPTWHAGPAARSVLPRTALLADHLSLVAAS